MAGKLDGRLAIITAGGSEMGRASAQLFAREGATVIVADLGGSAADEVVGSIAEDGGQAHSFEIDVSSVT
jgi:NAD(P)-dependent dehydrogenase (short-subunit alcohol dehydrogenase family)